MSGANLSTDPRIHFRAVDVARRYIDRAMDLPGGYVERIFLEFDAERIMRSAEAADQRQKDAYGTLPLHGVAVSLKDLFDEFGIVTSAGSSFLRNRAPACEDAKVVSALKAAGAFTCGRTNMSELAFTGLGLNPHFGSPENILDALRIPGGSSSGAMASVGLGLCDASLATDTGGSVRIPAALNSLYGFKPTRAAISTKGVFSICPSFDTVGFIARSLHMCTRLHAVLSGQCLVPRKVSSLDGLHVGLVASPLAEGLDTQVSADFDRAMLAIRDAGAIIAPVSEPALCHSTTCLGTICSYEATALVSGYLEGLKQSADPYVLERILQSAEVTSKEMEEARSKRVEAIRAFKEMAGKFDILIAPTVPIIAPMLSDIDSNLEKIGSQLSQNTRAVNWVDGCAATIPMNTYGTPGTGLMLFGRAGSDWHVLEMASLIDKVIAPARVKA